MKVEKSRCPITIVTGERLDITEWPLLNNEIKDLVHECGVQLVVDMAKTRFIDSTGLGKLISLLRTVTKNQGDIKIAGLNPNILELFKVTRLHRVFEIHDSVESAVDSFILSAPKV